MVVNKEYLDRLKDIANRIDDNELSALVVELDKIRLARNNHVANFMKEKRAENPLYARSAKEKEKRK